MKTEVAISRSNYENVFLTCPMCGQDQIYNRVSDLPTREPISGLDVTCLNDACKAPLWIMNDTINEAHEMILYSCSELLDQKRYMECVVQTCQAYEMFFKLHLMVELAYRPFTADRQSEPLQGVNDRLNRLDSTIERYAYAQMRNTSLHLAIAADRTRPMTAAQADVFIAGIPKFAKAAPVDSAILTLPNQALAQVFIGIKNTKIHSERNRVAHKSAYRPTRQIAEALLKDARSHLLHMSLGMKLHSNINFC